MTRLRQGFGGYAPRGQGFGGHAPRGQGFGGHAPRGQGFAGHAPRGQGDGGQTEPRLRIGIDVGGTFTDVVALRAETGVLVAQVKVPTSHRAPEGVARGIVDGLRLLLDQMGVDAASVGFIAHSTTQATNALLEGDVARVGIVGAGRAGERWKARVDTRGPASASAEGKQLRADHAFAAITDPEARHAAEKARYDWSLVTGQRELRRN